MIAKLVTLLVALGAAGAYTNKPLLGVDPNTLQCVPGEFLLLPHHEECHLYYQCDHGREILMPGCSAPLIFDFELQGCNWQRDTQCWLRTNPDDLESGSGDEGSGSGDLDWFQGRSEDGDEEEFEDLVDAQKNPSQVVLGSEAMHFKSALDCSRADEASRHVAYRGDCQRYWRCVGGVPETFYCSDGLFFDEAKQTCDFEGNVRCQVAQEDELQGEYMVYDK